MSRELPILFNTEMVQAVLSGNKTATRRLIRIQPHVAGDKMYRRGLIKQKYQIGDTLWVRETYHKYTKRVGEGESCRLQEFYGYKASIANSEDANEKWRPSIHMPKEAARIWLKVTDVTVERLQNMTIDDFLAEGVALRPEAFNDPDNAYLQAREIFKGIWDSTMKKEDIPNYGWDVNPWVWVIKFERSEKPEGLKNN